MRRAFTILAVLVVITISALVATATMRATDAQRSLIEASIRQTRSRAMAWSGVQAAMSELAEQREDLLDGAAPVLTEQWELIELDDGRRGVIRLVALDGGVALVESEAGKLNVNTATAEMLALIPGIDASLADGIVQRRGASPIPSVESLADVDGMSTDLLYGTGGAPGLTSLLTALSADPNVQTGVGAPTSSYRGDRKLNVNGAWSDRLGRAIADRYDEETAEGVKQLMEADMDLSSESRFVAFMRQSGSGPENWIEVLDVFTATPDPYTIGRVDVLTAPAQVLAAIPGLDEPTADAIVQARDSLDAESRRSVVWPVIEGLMTEAQFEEAVDHLATRSMQWRVRVEVGILDGGPEAMVAPSEDRGPLRDDVIGGSFRGADDAMSGEPDLEDRLVLEAVIDVSSQRPRVAYVRDVTHLNLAFRLDAMRLDVDESDDLFDDPAELVDLPAEVEDEMTMADARTFDPLGDDPLGEEMPTEDAPPGDETTDAYEGTDRRIGRWRVPAGDDS